MRVIIGLEGFGALGVLGFGAIWLQFPWKCYKLCTEDAFHVRVSKQGLGLTKGLKGLIRTL